jgi:hypothetical protein
MIKILFTAFLLMVMLIFISWIMMNVDDKREDEWFTICVVALLLAITLLCIGSIVVIWIY